MQFNDTLTSGDILILIGLIVLGFIGLWIYEDHKRRQNKKGLEKFVQQANHARAKRQKRIENVGNRIFSELNEICAEYKLSINRDPEGNLGYTISVFCGAEKLMAIYVSPDRSVDKAMVFILKGQSPERCPITDSAIASQIQGFKEFLRLHTDNPLLHPGCV
jgi:hypothetical protein